MIKACDATYTIITLMLAGKLCGTGMDHILGNMGIVSTNSIATDTGDAALLYLCTPGPNRQPRAGLSHRFPRWLALAGFLTLVARMLG